MDMTTEERIKEEIKKTYHHFVPLYDPELKNSYVYDTSNGLENITTMYFPNGRVAYETVTPRDDFEQEKLTPDHDLSQYRGSYSMPLERMLQIALTIRGDRFRQALKVDWPDNELFIEEVSKAYPWYEIRDSLDREDGDKLLHLNTCLLRQWYSNGQLRLYAIAADEDSDSHIEMYTPEGKLYAKGSICDKGRKFWTWTYYYDDGTQAQYHYHKHTITKKD